MISDDIDIFLVNYLSDNFVIQDYRWKYVGKEVGADYTLFFLEIEDFSLQYLDDPSYKTNYTDFFDGVRYRFDNALKI